jgi:hypothetical protein
MGGGTVIRDPSSSDRFAQEDDAGVDDMLKRAGQSAA